MPISTSGRAHHYLPRGPRNQADFAIAEACASAWYRERGGAHIQIPVGAVTALALWPLKGPDAWMLGSWWLSLNEDELTATLRECWARWWIQRPDLIHRARPLYAWLDDDRLRTAAMPAVKAGIRAAITEGILDLVGSSDPDLRTDTDVLGWMVTLMRSGGEQRMLAEFPTPSDMASLNARLAMPLWAADVRPGQSFHDPTSGTGAMIRAVAVYLRDLGLDPADFRWAMTDLDAVSAAVAACCSILWDLGPQVLVWCGDTLQEGNGPDLAAAEKAVLIAERNGMLRQFAALRGSLSLINDPSGRKHIQLPTQFAAVGTTSTKELTS